MARNFSGHWTSSVLHIIGTSMEAIVVGWPLA